MFFENPCISFKFKIGKLSIIFPSHSQTSTYFHEFPMIFLFIQLWMMALSNVCIEKIDLILFKYGLRKKKISIKLKCFHIRQHHKYDIWYKYIWIKHFRINVSHHILSGFCFFILLKHSSIAIFHFPFSVFLLFF